MAPTLRRRATKTNTRGVPARKPVRRKTPCKKQLVKPENVKKVSAVKPENIKKVSVAKPENVKKVSVVKPENFKKVSVMEDFTSNSSVTTSSIHNSSNDDILDFEGADVSTNSCSTPKAERYRIPEIVTCPPAPRKQRVASNWSLQRRPIAFFAPPDLELFFFFALSDHIPV